MKSAVNLKEEGNQFYKSGNYSGAIACYQQSLRVDVRYASAYYNLAQAYLKLSHYQEALNAFEAAIVFDAVSYTYKGNLGKAEALIGLGKTNDAWHALNKLPTSLELLAEKKETIARKMFALEQNIAAKVSFACVDLKMLKMSTFYIHIDCLTITSEKRMKRN